MIPGEKNLDDSSRYGKDENAADIQDWILVLDVHTSSIVFVFIFPLALNVLLVLEVFLRYF